MGFGLELRLVASGYEGKSSVDLSVAPLAQARRSSYPAGERCEHVDVSGEMHEDGALVEVLAVSEFHRQRVQFHGATARATDQSFSRLESFLLGG